jgi:hypothetical protein
MFPKLIVVGVLHFVKIVFVELSHETGEIGVFEHAG